MSVLPAICLIAIRATLGPPTVESPVPEAVVRDFGLAAHYQRCVMVGPFPIVSSRKVHEASLQEAAFLVELMTREKPEMLDALARSRTRFSIMAPDEMTTDIPEHSDLAPAGYWDKRARGLGATRQRPAVSCGEENLLCFQGDPYATENILIHEFAHALHEMALDTVDPTFDGRLKEVYASAIEEELWIDTYAATNRMEYFAEITQSYFDTNRVNDRDHNDIDTREELRAHDPRGFALCVEVYGADAPRYQRPFDRDPASAGFEHLRSWDRSKAPTFAWPVEVVRAWDRHQAGTLVPRRKRGESAMAFLKRRVAAEEPAALVEMGWRHREGEGVAQDDQLAVVYYRRASEQGDPAGMDSYGWMLKEGRGVEEDDQEAIALFRKSAEAGFSQGMFNLAIMLRDGRGVEAPDHDGARAWLAQAAQRGHVTAARLLQEWSP